jgi:hypothetical protein
MDLEIHEIGPGVSDAAGRYSGARVAGGWITGGGGLDGRLLVGRWADQARSVAGDGFASNANEGR